MAVAHLSEVAENASITRPVFQLIQPFKDLLSNFLDLSLQP